MADAEMVHELHVTEIKHWRRWATGEHLWYCACACGWRSTFALSPALAEEDEAQHLADRLERGE